MITVRQILVAAHRTCSQLIIVCKFPCCKCSAVRISRPKIENFFYSTSTTCVPL